MSLGLVATTKLPDAMSFLTAVMNCRMVGAVTMSDGSRFQHLIVLGKKLNLYASSDGCGFVIW